MWDKIVKLVLNPRFLLLVFVLAAIGASVQNVLLGLHPYIPPKPGTFPNDIMNTPEQMNLFIGKYLTEYNNYKIFKHSWFHLLNGTNLYGLYPDEHWDFYKYSPTFALLMSSMSYFPDMLGLSIWNILNAITVFFAIRTLPFKDKTQAMLMWLTAMELLTCLQNNQSNGLMCGLVIAAYGCMEKGKPMLATLWLALSVYIKVYGAIGFCLFLFYPQYRIKFALWGTIWMVLFAILPLVVTSPSTLVWQYLNWAALMKADAAAATGLSVAGWLHTWFGLDNVKSAVSIGGLLLFLAQFVRVDLYRNEVYKILMVASMLLWVVIFNHKAESPTFVIAVAGAGIWYYARPKATWRLVTILVVFIFTSLSTTDIFPPPVRKALIYPYTIKAVPCILAWCVVLLEILFLKREARIPSERHAPTVVL
ncbi:MAG: DUF2029 domain-containing protein [Taibaiella sp.]|nr:DUF2029 domain-containing protein [Taibaiella sp.]